MGMFSFLGIGNNKAPGNGGDSNQYLGEMKGGMQAQAGAIPYGVELERNILPGLQQYQRESMGSQGQNLLGIYGDMQGYSNQNANQYQNQLLSMFGGSGVGATNYAVQSLGAQGAQNYNMFQQQAGMGLAMGSQLGYQDQQAAQQSARAAMAARGLTGNQAVGQEVLNSYQLGNQRMLQRQQMGMQANQMAMQQQAFGQQSYLNPAMQSSQGVYGLSQLHAATQGSFANLGPQFLQPESQYLANIRANRIQQENAIASANAQETGGFLGAAGSIIGASIIACWVAREVYGTETGEWLIFRQWMENESPKWFKSLYYQEGERFAKFISDKPILKSIVKSAMNIIVKPRLNLIKFYA